MSLLAHKFYEFIWLILKINGIRDVKTSLERQKTPS